MNRVLQAFVIFAGCAFGQSPTAVTLDRAIQEALDRNLSLLAAKFEVPVAEARMITAKLRPNPVLTLSGDHLDLLGTGFNTQNNAGPNEFAARTDFVFERGHKREVRMAVAEQDREIARLNVATAVRGVLLDVENAFLDMQVAKESLQLATQNQKALQGIVDINQTRVRTGDLALVELTRSQLAALQLQTAVQQARIRLEEAKNRLQLQMGRISPAPDFDITGDFRRDSVTGSLDVLMASALEKRSDISALRISQARSRDDLRLQLAQGKVDYTVGTEYRRQQAPSGTGNSLGIFFSAPLPVFNRNQGEVERARREIDQAGARIRALEASVRNDVINAWQRYQTSRGLLQTVETDMLEQASSVRKTTEYSYRRGEASLIEFLDAQRAFNEAMQTWNEARADYARSVYLLESLAGLKQDQGEKR